MPGPFIRPLKDRGAAVIRSLLQLRECRVQAGRQSKILTRTT